MERKERGDRGTEDWAKYFRIKEEGRKKNIPSCHYQSKPKEQNDTIFITTIFIFKNCPKL